MTYFKVPPVWNRRLHSAISPEHGKQTSTFVKKEELL